MNTSTDPRSDSSHERVRTTGAAMVMGDRLVVTTLARMRSTILEFLSRKCSRTPFLLGAAVVMQITAGLAHAQPNVPVLKLTVRDDTGAPVPGAEIHVQDFRPTSSAQAPRLTNDEGVHLLPLTFAEDPLARNMAALHVSVRHPRYASRTLWFSVTGGAGRKLPTDASVTLKRGIAIGGVVVDEQQNPVPNVAVLLSGGDYSVFETSQSATQREFSEVQFNDPASPAAVTDLAGRWIFEPFPADVNQLHVTFVRPDGARQVFSTGNAPYESFVGFMGRPLIALDDLKARTAVAALEEGLVVRGHVVDEEGRPLTGVKITEGYGHGNIVRISEFEPDANGRFERPHRAPRQWIYTATRPDRATASVVAQVEPGMSDLRIVLSPAKPVTFRITDEENRPLKDVELSVEPFSTEAQILDWRATTGADGMAVWSNAPIQKATVIAQSRGQGVSRKVRVQAGDGEKQIQLRRSAADRVIVRIRATDAATGESVKVSRVGVRYDGAGSPFRTLLQPDASEFELPIRQGQSSQGVYTSYELQFQAPGYVDLQLDPLDFQEGDQDRVLAFERSREGPVLFTLPDGTPAAGARIWCSGLAEEGRVLHISNRGRYFGDGLTQAVADDRGYAQVPGVKGETPIIVTHSEGFLARPANEILKASEVRLESYGTVEGVLRIAGKPVSGASLNLTPLVWSPSRGFYFNETETTDAEGRFRFARVPPGEFKLYRWFPPQGRVPMYRPVVETCQMPITVKAGEVLEVDYASRGRAVVGVAVANPPDVVIPWQNDDHVLDLKHAPAKTPRRPHPEDFATLAAFQKANLSSFDAESNRAQALAARTYKLHFEFDGSFRAEDVPPGTYVLRISVTKPNSEASPHPFPESVPTLASLTREVVVPDGTEPFDLGVLTIPVAADSGVMTAEPVEIEAASLEGNRVRLSDYRGRPVVLALWAAWSERSLRQLEEIDALRAALGASADATAFVSVELGGALSDVRPAVGTLAAGWSHAVLEPAAVVSLAAQFDVTTLPLVLLIDRQGRVSGRDLEVTQLRRALERMLASNQARK